MGSSSSSLVSSSNERTKEAFQFILNQTIPGYGDVFEKVSSDDLQPGDIVLFPKGSSGGALSSIFKHAAVYWKDGEIIHLQKNRKKQVRITKEGFNSMKSKSGKCQVYRKKGGINLEDFERNVSNAMCSEAKYGLYKNNCIHFALSLLGLVKFYVDLVKTPNEGRKKKKRCIVM